MKALFLLLLFSLFFSFGRKDNIIYVSPDGNDHNKGTLAAPVATVAQAQQLARGLKKKLSPGDTLTICLRGGTYRLQEGILLQSGDGGSRDNPIVYRSYKGEQVTLSGAIRLKHYSHLSHTSPLYKRDPATGRKILEIDLGENGLTGFKPLRLAGFNGEEAPKHYTLRQLFCNGRAMPLSRWPDKGFTNFTDVVKDKDGKTGIVYQDPHISGWTGEPNILLHGYWYHLWADAWEQVAGIDTNRHVLWLTPPYNHYTFRKDHPFAAYNVISEIDRPGEWAYDYREKKIWFYPPEGLQDTTLELSVCESPLLTLDSVEWVIFRDLHFEMGAAAGVEITGSRHIGLERCDLNGLSRDGILIEGGRDITITSCRINDMGRGGIRIDAGSRETLARGDVVIDNCHIYDLSHIDHTYTPGIWTDGTGTTIRHCRIHDVPSSAMRINGNDHLIEYNELFRVVTESDDQGAIDMWGDPTYRGNVFRYNYIHDTGPQGQDRMHAITGRAGIRFDDAISGNRVYGNVFRNCSGGHFGAIQIHGGKENLIRNNIFYRCSAGISFTPWSFKHWTDYTKHSQEFLAQHQDLYVSRYPELTHLNENLNVNTITGNVFLACDQVTLRQPKTVIFRDNLVLDKYPAPGNPEQDRYSLRSIAEKLKKIGFKPVPFGEMGLK